MKKALASSQRKVVLFFPRPWPGAEMAGRMPFSLLHLYSYLKDDENFDIRIVDERLVPDMEALIDDLGDNVLCFGISSFTGLQIANGLKIANMLRRRFHKVPIVWGGWHPSSTPEQTLKNPLVDIVVRYQGEDTFKNLLYSLLEGQSLSRIDGISYKEDSRIIHNPERKLLPLLETLKLSYDAIDVEKYVYRMPWGNRTIGMITSLGCPFNCGFCAVATGYKRKVFYRNLDYVFEEIDYMVDRYKINAITFDDDNFFVSPKRVKEFCERLIGKPYRISWDAGAHVGILLKQYDDETLKLVKESGCKQLYIGAESGSDEVLDIINKKATVSQTFEYVRKMRELGIKSFLSTMVCFPGVTSRDIYTTMDMILKCRDIDHDLGYRLFYYTPYPGTPLYEKAIRSGMKEPQSLEEWSKHTLRKFRAPWIKRSFRKQIRFFYFYYFPYSAETMHGDYDPDAKLFKRFLINIYRLIFENRLLRHLAKWRAKKLYFGFPFDAYFVIYGQHLKSLYNRLFNKRIDLYYDYED
jgi:radical SAM superfamily enzyme YgiQ (UPF0313 family)